MTYDIAQDQLFETIKLLYGYYQSQDKADQTIECRIIDNSKAAWHKYTVVTNNKIRLEVQSESTSYEINDRVHVLIPQGDYNATKRIIGKCYDEVTEDEAEEELNFIPMTESIKTFLNSEERIKDWITKSNQTIRFDDVGVWKIIDGKFTIQNCIIEVKYEQEEGQEEGQEDYRPFKGNFAGKIYNSNNEEITNIETGVDYLINPGGTEPPSFSGYIYLKRGTAKEDGAVGKINIPSNSGLIEYNTIEVSIEDLTDYKSEDVGQNSMVIAFYEGEKQIGLFEQFFGVPHKNENRKIKELVPILSQPINNLKMSIMILGLTADSKETFPMTIGSISVRLGNSINQSLLAYSEQGSKYKEFYNKNLIPDTDFSQLAQWISDANSRLLTRSGCAYNAPVLSGRTQISLKTNECDLFEKKAGWTLLNSYINYPADLNFSGVDLNPLSTLTIRPTNEGGEYINTKWNGIETNYPLYGIKTSLLDGATAGTKYYLSFQADFSRLFDINKNLLVLKTSYDDDKEKSIINYFILGSKNDSYVFKRYNDNHFLFEGILFPKPESSKGTTEGTTKSPTNFTVSILCQHLAAFSERYPIKPPEGNEGESVFRIKNGNKTYSSSTFTVDNPAYVMSCITGIESIVNNPNYKAKVQGTSIYRNLILTNENPDEADEITGDILLHWHSLLNSNYALVNFNKNYLAFREANDEDPFISVIEMIPSDEIKLTDYWPDNRGVNEENFRSIVNRYLNSNDYIDDLPGNKIVDIISGQEQYFTIVPSRTQHYNRQFFTIYNLVCFENDYKKKKILKLYPDLPENAQITLSGLYNYGQTIDQYWARWYNIEDSKEIYVPVRNLSNPMYCLPESDKVKTHTFRAKLYHNGEVIQTNDYTFEKEEEGGSN